MQIKFLIGDQWCHSELQGPRCCGFCEGAIEQWS